jgi:4-amino-4-deoxy-L-arabinose transferase-like glycosyltransferase
VAQRHRLAEPASGLDWGLVVILVLAGALRLHLASTQAYVHDENNTAIPLSKTISFAPAHLNLPLRGENHGALPAYVVKASSSLFGTSMLGYRGLHVLLGLATITLVFAVSRHAFGVGAARWAAMLLAFNDYYLGVSTRATAHVPHLFFVSLALYAFSRFLATERAGYLYGVAASIGGAFYCKESSALLLPVFAMVVLLSARHRRWLLSPHTYLACLTFAGVIGADLVWNSRASVRAARVAYGGQVVEQATYRNHLDRIGGLGLSPYPLMFYARDAVQTAAVRVTGRELVDETPEYPSLNIVLGVVVLAGVAVTTMRPGAFQPPALLFVAAFWCVFLFFSFIATGATRGRLDAVSWIWVETSILSASVLAGAWLAGLRGLLAAVMGAVTVAGLAWAAAEPLAGLWRLGRWAAEEGRSAVSHAGQVLAMELVVLVRARPLVAIAVALAAGAVFGLVVGITVGRGSRRGRS